MIKLIRILKKLWRKLFPPKPQICHDGMFEYNLTKRENIHEEVATRKPVKPGSGGTPPPPLPPPLGRSVVFLDFDGYTVKNTNWNYNGDIVCAPANLSAADQLVIFNNIVEDYAPFNVVVTMDEAVYDQADPYRRTRCIITESWEWYGQSGGVAFIGSMFWGDNTPCFVFSSLLHYNTKNIKEAVSHEVGHTIALRHQSVYDNNCIKTSEYNLGNSQCSCALSWVQLIINQMGNGG